MAKVEGAFIGYVYLGGFITGGCCDPVVML